MGCSRPLPLSPEFNDPEVYVESLLRFATSSELFQRLCGGVHILDFFTRKPDLYSTILPQEWRDWFYLHDVQDILDLLMRENLNQFQSFVSGDKKASVFDSKGHDMNGFDPEGLGPDELDINCLDTNGVDTNGSDASARWRSHRMPPDSLIEYIQTIRKHSLDRTFESIDDPQRIRKSKSRTKLTRNVVVGMKTKKIHEVENFARYIDNLSSDITLTTNHRVTHLVDFGSGQNYLGRALASQPYNQNVIAIESKTHNIDGAKHMDVTAKLAKKEMVMRNKKEFRKGTAAHNNNPLNGPRVQPSREPRPPAANQTQDENNGGSINYIELVIQHGNLSVIAKQIPEDAQLMVVSLHSCGNLLHHGIRSLILNSSVKAIAMVGCCYNLVTERLGPPTYKLPSMRSSSLRLDQTSSACDPNGFPMSERLAQFKHHQDRGVRFNITARMMAVQAPYNWTLVDCTSFFTRHFYRALLQRIFLDWGVVGQPTPLDDTPTGISPRGWTGEGEPILIGSLRKSCYDSFTAYVRGALAKLSDSNNTNNGHRIAKCMSTLTDDDIARYEATYQSQKKELSLIWSLMAFSAGVVESIIVVDRWLFLREQDEVADCWVEAVFEYEQSPRNLVVVGIKR